LQYRWSSYRDSGQDDEERQLAYRELFRHELEPGEIDQIRKVTKGNLALGSCRFGEKISEMLGRRVINGKAGRPRKKFIVSKCQKQRGLSPLFSFSSFSFHFVSELPRNMRRRTIPLQYLCIFCIKILLKGIKNTSYFPCKQLR
jgi:hypothetical protein